MEVQPVVQFNFDVTVGAEDIVLYQLDLNTAELGQFTVDVYTLLGTYVGNETDPGAWDTSDQWFWR